ncbi:FAD-dependent oxidoreductase [Nocardioides alcanivorans]|uniref:FAD-dependent oxidoreductase n=1 Tax=Nocardioides alcanivorans TaxID=2897352 RepID=UPI001F1F76C8|nr:FAD-dependent oxidoreductase [Nocardioides alcanivorans]
MPFAITQTCCADATCVSVCPVNCIHPTPDEPDFGSTDMLYVDPRSCIDCGACADACPVDAILPISSLTGPEQAYAEINASWFDTVTPGSTDRAPAPGPRPDRPTFHDWDRPRFDRVLPADFPRLSVAVVGSGPSGMYAVEDLLLHTDADITVFERLQVPDGLVRFGVAPDHPATKQVAHNFARLRKHARVTVRFGVEVGRDVSPEQLAADHDAVIHAVGAHAEKRLGVPGEELPGSISATRFVAWYNGHPDVPADSFHLDAERVVVIGNGNVALDVARILVSDPDVLADTSIASHALTELRSSRVREVVVLGRRGPEHAAYTRPEAMALTHLPSAELVVDDHDPRVGEAIDTAGPRDHASVLAGVRREAVDWSRQPAAGRRIVLRFHSSPWP